MSYKIEIDYAPAYELVISLNAYLQKKYHKNMDLGKEWMASVEKQLTPEFRKELSFLTLDYTDLLFILVYHCPGERTPEQFLRWLKSLSLEELSRILSSYVKKIPIDMKISLHNYIAALGRWNEQYFSKLNPMILCGLAEDAEHKKAAASRLTSEKLFEEATRGMRISKAAPDSVVRLIPQYHLSPMNSTYYFGNLYICFYACSLLSEKAEEPPISLRRLTHCIADETRLKLLRLISLQPRTFTELVELTGISKSTIHHHLIALRGAGLVYLDMVDRNSSYSLRKEGIRELCVLLEQYLNAGKV